jgi:hypothetical protein
MILSTFSFLSATILNGVQRKPIFPQLSSTLRGSAPPCRPSPRLPARGLVLRQGRSHQRRVVDELLADLTILSPASFLGYCSYSRPYGLSCP